MEKFCCLALNVVSLLFIAWEEPTDLSSQPRLLYRDPGLRCSQTQAWQGQGDSASCCGWSWLLNSASDRDPWMLLREGEIGTQRDTKGRGLLDVFRWQKLDILWRFSRKVLGWISCWGIHQDLMASATKPFSTVLWFRILGSQGRKHLCLQMVILLLFIKGKIRQMTQLFSSGDIMKNSTFIYILWFFSLI